MNSLHEDLVNLVMEHARTNGTENWWDLKNCTMKVPFGVSAGKEGIQLLDWSSRPEGAPMFKKPLSRKQALGLGVLLIKASQS